MLQQCHTPKTLYEHAQLSRNVHETVVMCSIRRPRNLLWMADHCVGIVEYIRTYIVEYYVLSEVGGW